MKFYKLVNNIWTETACVDNYDVDCNFRNIDKLAYKLGYVRIFSTTTHRLTNNFYYMADCARVKSTLHGLYVSRDAYLATCDYEATDYVYFSCSQQKFDNFTNAELASIYQLARCEDCGDIVRLRDIRKVGRNHYFCAECIDKHATKCNVCGRWYMKRSTLTEYNLVGSSAPTRVCNHCRPRFEATLHRCADCGGLVTYNYEQIRGQIYCYDCAERHQVPNLIAGYHSGHLDIQKQFASTETPAEDIFVGGTEIETECGRTEPRYVAYDVNNVMNSRDAILCKFETDGSLSNGFEIITQPCSLQWYYENISKITNLFDTLNKNNCSYKTPTGRETCGLHIHINRSFFKDYDYENRLCYLFQRLASKIRKFSQRNEFGYCSFATGACTWQNIYQQKRSQMQGHGSALNCSNRDTIEFRIYRGTTDLTTYMACLEFTHNLCKYVRDNTSIEKIERTTFEDVVNYCDNKYLNEYCTRLGLLGGAC